MVVEEEEVDTTTVTDMFLHTCAVKVVWEEAVVKEDPLAHTVEHQ